MKRFTCLVIVLIALLIASAAISAQSSDRDHPTPMRSGELSGSLDNNNEENFYSFVAGPGTLTITVDVKARKDDIGVLNFELLARNGGTSILCCEFAQGDGGGTGRDVKSIKITKRQTIILHTTNGPVGGGTFHIRLTGPVSFEGSSKN
jgi:hypothetical protein